MTIGTNEVEVDDAELGDDELEVDKGGFDLQDSDADDDEAGDDEPKDDKDGVNPLDSDADDDEAGDNEPEDDKDEANPPDWTPTRRSLETTTTSWAIKRAISTWRTLMKTMTPPPRRLTPALALAPPIVAIDDDDVARFEDRARKLLAAMSTWCRTIVTLEDFQELTGLTDRWFRKLSAPTADIDELSQMALDATGQLVRRKEDLGRACEKA